jgi:eukaryotic-like serine/threonine-protein kinase
MPPDGPSQRPLPPDDDVEPTIDTPPAPPAHVSASDQESGSWLGVVAPDLTDESAFVHAILDMGLAEEPEINDVLRLRADDPERADEPLDRLLLDQHVLTRRQLHRVRLRLAQQRDQTRIPGYVLHARIGKGAAGTVLRATQTALDRPVAIKVLPRAHALSEARIERLRNEARAVAKLDHPNIVRAIDVGRAGNVHYFVMELVEGRTLHQCVKDEGPLSERRALTLVRAIAAALAHAHANKLVHLDVKPKNILITPGGVAKLADLGLAHWLEEAWWRETGRPFGSPEYLSPEQARGDTDIGPTSDIYSLGATWHFALFGRPPFTAGTVERVLQMHQHTSPDHPRVHRPELTEGLCDVMMTMLAKDPADRYPGAIALAEELDAWHAVLLMREGERAASDGSS